VETTRDCGGGGTGLAVAATGKKAANRKAAAEKNGPQLRIFKVFVLVRFL
jgi:hypothetical protein